MCANIYIAQEPVLLLFDDVSVGDVWRSPDRTITESDVHEFAALTGDYNPLHLDAEFAASTPFHRPVAHGLLGLSVLAGLSSQYPLMDTLAFVGISDWKFLQPVFFGDTVVVETEVVEKRAANRRHGLIAWQRRLINQQGEVVQRGSLETLVRVRQARTQPAATVVPAAVVLPAASPSALPH